MPIRIYNSSGQSQPPLSFREFWLSMQNLVGESSITLETQASTIKEFIDNTKQPFSFSQELIIRSYKASDCVNLESNIDLNSVLDVMGDIAWNLKLNSNDDLMSVELLEEIAHYISTLYKEQIKPKANTSDNDAVEEQSKIIQFKSR